MFLFLLSFIPLHYSPKQEEEKQHFRIDNTKQTMLLSLSDKSDRVTEIKLSIILILSDANPVPAAER